MESTENNLNLPFDVESINKQAENIALKQIEVEAEKLKLKDLSEIMNNFKQLTDAYINVEKADYLEEGYKVLIDEKETPTNNEDYKKEPNLEDILKKVA